MRVCLLLPEPTVFISRYISVFFMSIHGEKEILEKLTECKKFILLDGRDQ